eukprot:223570_1
MAVTVGYSGYFDQERNYRIDYESRMLIFTISRKDRKRMKDFSFDLMEKSFTYPTCNQIDNDKIVITTAFNDGSQKDIPLANLVKKYSLTVCKFLINQRLQTEEMKNYINIYGVVVTHENNLQDLAYLKYRAKDRVVKITAISPISESIQIFSFMQKHIRKYVVQHVEWDDINKKWKLVTRLADGTTLVPPGGAECVSDHEIDLICTQQQLPIIEHLILENYILKQKFQVLHKYYEQNAEQWLDFMEGSIETYLNSSRYWNRWNIEMLFIKSSNKKKELDEVLRKYDIEEQWIHNKCKSQQTMKIDIDGIETLFGDEIQRHVTDKAEKYIVTASSMRITYYENRCPPKKNLKIEIYVLKTRFKKTK